MIIKTIVFKREQNSSSEVGIEVENGPIIDSEGKIVPLPIYNSKSILGLTVDMNPIIQALSKIKYNL